VIYIYENAAFVKGLNRAAVCGATTVEVPHQESDRYRTRRENAAKRIYFTFIEINRFDM